MGSIVRVEYEDLGGDVYGVDIEDGEFSGSLSCHDGRWHWELFEGDDQLAFAAGEAITIELAKDDIQSAAIDRICQSIR